MKCERRPFLEEHLDAMDLKPIFLEGAMETALAVSRRPGSFTETIFHGDRPIAVIGLVVLWRGVGTVWSLTSPNVADCGKGFHVEILKAIEEYARELGLWRIQMNVVARFKQNVRWAETLGFRNEGRMVKFDPMKQDYFRFARIFNG